MLHRLIEQIHRRERGAILAGLIRRLGNFDLAEDALQDAYAQALASWPRDGLPASPAAWLTTVARHRAIDRLRHDARFVADAEPLIAALAAPETQALPQPDGAAEAGEVFADDRLRLIFTCCHPAIAPAAAAALALRTLCGLSTREIGRAFVEPESTTAQKIVRAKRKIETARIAFAVPARDDLPQRLAAVLAVLYLVFNEGYAASASAALLRPDLCAEGLRLAALLDALLPQEPECAGLLALMQLHEARRDARIDSRGVLVPLEAQDRSLWKRTLIGEALQRLDAAMLLRRPGPYQIQAAIAALHAQAVQPQDTDWRQISALYGALLRYWPTPVVELNAAVALAMSTGVEQGLAWMDAIAARGELTDYHLLHAARADLLRRAGRQAEARQAYGEALRLTANAAEQAYLRQRLNALGGDTAP